MGQNASAFICITDQDMKAFVNVWKKFDPKATGFINAQDLETLILNLFQDDSCGLLYLKKQITLRREYHLRRIADFNIPIYENFQKFYFHDLLLCLCRAKFENEFDLKRD